VDWIVRFLSWELFVLDQELILDWGFFPFKHKSSPPLMLTYYEANGKPETYVKMKTSLLHLDDNIRSITIDMGTTNECLLRLLILF
jgi:hypothetical protein